MTITKYRPKSTLSPFSEMFNEFFGLDMPGFVGSGELKNSLPSVNIIEREGEFKLEMLAPGFKKDEMKLDVEDQVLTISADHKSEELAENERYTRREFTHSSFTRNFRLPDQVNTDKIKAEFHDGVLNVTIPKAEVTKPKAKKIDIR